MSRPIGPGGSIDIRSAKILEDFTYSGSPCIIGSTPAKRRRYWDSPFFQGLPEDAEQKNPLNYDSGKDWLRCFMSAFICLVTVGTLQSFSILFPHVATIYPQITENQFSIIGATSYTIVFLLSPVAACIIRSMGHRLTCGLGLLIFSCGLLLDSLEYAYPVFFVSRILFIGVGVSMALTASVTCVMLRFRKQLGLALALVVVSLPAGTAMFLGLLYIFAVDTNLSYKWVMMMFALLGLCCIAVAHGLPRSPYQQDRHPDPFQERRTTSRKNALKDCVADAINADAINADGTINGGCNCNEFEQNESENEESCFCVCMIDVSIITDTSFILWAVVSSLSMITLYVPYSFIIWHAHLEFNVSIGDSILILVWFCLASMGGRAYIVTSMDFTFGFSRLIFQFGCLGTAVMYLVLHLVSTHGWFILWGVVTGLLEGMLVGIIPRLTLQTVPKKHIPWSWVYLVILNSLAIMIGPILIVSIKVVTNAGMGLACVVIGILQIVAGILVIFIPNEENQEDEDTVSDSHHSRWKYPGGLVFNPNGTINDWLGVNYNSGTSQFTTEDFVSGVCGLCPVRSSNTDYACNCPVCAGLGCNVSNMGNSVTLTTTKVLEKASSNPEEKSSITIPVNE